MSKIKNKLFNIFFFLFTFAMFNREFGLFKVDLRIIVAALGIVILFFNVLLHKKEKSFKIGKFEKIIIAFYIISLFSNIMWYFNGLTINMENFKVILFSYLLNFEFFIVFALNKDNFSVKKLWINIFVSSMVLLFSMYCANVGIDIQRHLYSGCRGYVQDFASNFLGGRYRVAGYAEDPNYASLFMIISFATNIYYKKNCNRKFGIFDICYYALLIFGLLISASKTVILALFVALILCNFKKYQKINNFIIVILIFGPILFVISKINIFANMMTMFQRITMWNKALILFFKNPIIGSGLTSFRSFFLSSGYWYVQCHSTIFQILSETGIICLIIFTVLLIHNIKVNNKYLRFITFLYTVSMITTETVYHAYFIFIVGILPMMIEVVKNETKEQES